MKLKDVQVGMRIRDTSLGEGREVEELMADEMTERPHLQDRRDDWADASDEEWVLALLNPPALICPFFMAYAQRCRSHCLRKALLLHEQCGGFPGRPARRFLGRRR